MASESCEFYRKLKQRKQREQGIGLLDFETELPPEKMGLPDIEDFVSVAKSQKLCPFHLARLQHEAAEVVLLPYNYLVDSSMRTKLNIKQASPQFSPLPSLQLPFLPPPPPPFSRVSQPIWSRRVSLPNPSPNLSPTLHAQPQRRHPHLRRGA